ncbi:hypothetical protein [Nonomuraea sp. GTA35]|uniref:hypothetical protein n=1 Tax=Nonomuraea sp. GTA35 TaxID=1676746 RepID=UPI0035BFC35B
MDTGDARALLATLGIDLDRAHRSTRAGADDPAPWSLRRSPVRPLRVMLYGPLGQLSLALHARKAVEVAMWRASGRPVTGEDLVWGLLEGHANGAARILAGAGADLCELVQELRGSAARRGFGRPCLRERDLRERFAVPLLKELGGPSGRSHAKQDDTREHSASTGAADEGQHRKRRGPGDGEPGDRVEEVEVEIAAKSGSTAVNTELAAMGKIHDMLAGLEDPTARRRVLGWASGIFTGAPAVD